MTRRGRSYSVQLGGRSRSAATLPTQLLEPKLEIDGYRRGRSNSVFNKMPQSPFFKKGSKQQGTDTLESRTKGSARDGGVTLGTQQQNGPRSRSVSSTSEQSPRSPPPPAGNFFDFDEDKIPEDVLTEAPEKLVKQLRQQAKERMRWALEVNASSSH